MRRCTGLIGQDGVDHAQLLIEVGCPGQRGRVRLLMIHGLVSVDEYERLQ